jgi:hypothetical protein
VQGQEIKIPTLGRKERGKSGLQRVPQRIATYDQHTGTYVTHIYVDYTGAARMFARCPAQEASKDLFTRAGPIVA